MSAGPYTTNSSSLNLVEQIALYSTFVMVHGQQEGDDFLVREVPPDLHSAIRACVNNKGVLINSSGGEFFMEHYHGILLP